MPMSVRYALCGVEDECGSSQCNDGSIIETDAVLGSEYLVHEKGAGDAVVIAKGVDEVPAFPSLDVENAMATIHAGIISLNRNIYFIAFVATAYSVVSYM